jgi:hypothetical protein
MTAKWFRSYLMDRKQKIEIKSHNNTQKLFLNWGTIEPGVSQGSVLETLLLIMYVSGLWQQ